MLKISTQRIESLLYNRMKPVLEIHVDFPQFSGKITQRSEQTLNRFYRADAKRLNAYARTDLYARAAADRRQAEHMGGEFNFYSLYQLFTVTLNGSRLLSLFEDRSQYTGGAHPNTVRVSQTWDVNDGRMLRLRDFFKPGFDGRAYLLNGVLAQYEKDPNRARYFDDAPDLLKKYFREKNFYLSPEGFVLFYPLYTVAPYASGIPTFTVPYPAAAENPSRALR